MTHKDGWGDENGKSSLKRMCYVLRNIFFLFLLKKNIHHVTVNTRLHNDLFIYFTIHFYMHLIDLFNLIWNIYFYKCCDFWVTKGIHKEQGYYI